MLSSSSGEDTAGRGDRVPWGSARIPEALEVVAPDAETLVRVQLTALGLAWCLP